MPKINSAILTVPSKEKGISRLKFLKKLALKRKGEITIPDIRKRIKAKLKGGNPTSPIFVTVDVTPPKIEHSNINIIALFLSLIYFK
jgi:hypothetical protein